MEDEDDEEEEEERGGGERIASLGEEGGGVIEGNFHIRGGGGVCVDGIDKVYFNFWFCKKVRRESRRRVEEWGEIEKEIKNRA